MALAWLLLAVASARAASAETQCVGIDDDARRLACYDRAAGRSAPPPVNRSAPPTQPPAPAPPSLSKAWELDAADKRGTFNFVPHRLNYVLPVRYTTRANMMPTSPAASNGLALPLPVDATEAKFQLSFKLKAWENIFGDNGDLWLAYTQQSNWQLYNASASRPFRETDYEPEVILSLRTDVNVLGWRWKLLNLGLVHQSNGRANPLSRSWNRITAEFGLERGNFTLIARPWVRLNEGTSTDDNPDIRDYMGSGDLRLAYASGGHVLSALGRYSVGGRRGGLTLEWAFPLDGALKGYVQVTSGYGESLIDYNHAQSTLGVGVLLLPW